MRRLTVTETRGSDMCARADLRYPPPPLTDKTSISVMFQKDFQKCTSRFCVIRSNSAPRSSGSMAYFPEVKKELAATPAQNQEGHERWKHTRCWEGITEQSGRGGGG
uniref:Uncharacterized protein n=1 Tax=Paramormyrops kingsleyae TaxID=1676925 RepID=A0A3B3QBE3_9TELE